MHLTAWLQNELWKFMSRFLIAWLLTPRIWKNRPIPAALKFWPRLLLPIPDDLIPVLMRIWCPSRYLWEIFALLPPRCITETRSETTGSNRLSCQQSCHTIVRISCDLAHLVTLLDSWFFRNILRPVGINMLGRNATALTRVTGHYSVPGKCN